MEIHGPIRARRGRRARGEITLRDKVASQLLRRGRGYGALRAIRLEPKCVARCRLVEVQLVDSAFARRARAFRRGLAGRARMDERCALVVELLEVNHELGWVVLCVREHLRAEKRNDVVTDDVDGLGLEVGIIDTEMGVEPVHFVGNEFAWDETLETCCQ